MRLPALNDNDGTDLQAWLCTIPGIPLWWGADLDAPCIDTKPAPDLTVLSHGEDYGDA